MVDVLSNALPFLILALKISILILSVYLYDLYGEENFEAWF